MKTSNSTTRPQALRRLAVLALAAALLAPVAFAQPADDAGENAVGVAQAQPLAERAAASYRVQARYPDHSRALAPGAADPVRERRTPTPHSLRLGDDAPGITVWSGELSYEHPATVSLYATVDPGPNRSGRLGASIRGEVVTQSGDLVGTVEYHDDGEGADRRAGDGIHTATFQVPDGFVPDLAATFGVKVTAVTDAGDMVGVLGGFLYGQPHARLTGEYADSVRNGDLVVSVGVKVEKAGRFYLEGTLASAKGGPNAEALGWAQTAVELEPGTHWLELPFHGLMFHERGAAGPYVVRSLALSTTTGMPNALNDLVEDAHRTRAYPLARFTQRPFANPGLLNAAQRLETQAGEQDNGNR